MTGSAVTESQRKAAKVVGLAYLLAVPLAVFAEFYVSGRLIDYDDAAATAANIVANERLFRLGIASNLAVFALDVVLIVALYAVLRPINRNLALLATLWRVVETAFLVGVTARDLDIVRTLSGALYLRAFEADRLQALARLAIGAHGAGYNIGLTFAGLGSTVFAWLWYRSRYIPRVLAASGLFASLLLASCTFSFVIFPEWARVVSVAYYGGPIFIFEVAMGAWLLFARLREAPAAGP
jgi:hypothetical protein